MKVWRPELTPTCGLITFALYTIVFIVFGVILKSSSDSVVDVDIAKYNKMADCAVGKTCTVEFTPTEKIPAPVYMYYQLDNFY
jgi:hypothetical protein